jgi:hypothetical protein
MHFNVFFYECISLYGLVYFTFFHWIVSLTNYENWVAVVTKLRTTAQSMRFMQSVFSCNRIGLCPKFLFPFFA